MNGSSGWSLGVKSRVAVATVFSWCAACASTSGPAPSSPPAVAAAPAAPPPAAPPARSAVNPEAIAAEIAAGDRAADAQPPDVQQALASYAHAAALADDGLRDGPPSGDRARVAALRDRANVARARTLVARVHADKGRGAPAASRDLDEAAVALSAVEDRELSGYGSVKTALAAERASLEAPAAKESPPPATPEAEPPAPTKAPATKKAVAVEKRSSKKEARADVAEAPRPAHPAPAVLAKADMPPPTPSPTSQKRAVAEVASAKISDPPPAAGGPPDASCGAVPSGVPALRLKNDRDGTGGAVRGKLAAGGTASHTLAICSVGNLELVAPSGFRIESDAPGLSTAKQKTFVSGPAGLQWELPVTPGKLVKFKVIRTDGGPESYRVSYYLYPR